MQDLTPGLPGAGSDRRLRESGWPEGFQVGEIGIAYDVQLPDDAEIVSLSCSDDRAWAKAGLFRAAMRVAEGSDSDSV